MASLWVNSRTHTGDRGGDVPADAILQKLTYTPNAVPTGVAGFGSDDTGYEGALQHYWRREIVDWGPDDPLFEHEHQRRDGTASRQHLAHRFGGGRYDPAGVHHPELFIGHLDQDPRGRDVHNPVNAARLRHHGITRAMQRTRTMTDSIGHGGDNELGQVADRPWSGQDLSDKRKQMHRIVKDRTKVFKESKLTRTTQAGGTVANPYHRANIAATHRVGGDEGFAAQTRDQAVGAGGLVIGGAQHLGPDAITAGNLTRQTAGSDPFRAARAQTAPRGRNGRHTGETGAREAREGQSLASAREGKARRAGLAGTREGYAGARREAQASGRFAEGRQRDSGAGAGFQQGSNDRAALRDIRANVRAVPGSDAARGDMGRGAQYRRGRTARDGEGRGVVSLKAARENTARGDGNHRRTRGMGGSRLRGVAGALDKGVLADGEGKVGDREGGYGGGRAFRDPGAARFGQEREGNLGHTFEM